MLTDNAAPGVYASMGPPSEDGGYHGGSDTVGTDAGGFNGAAV